MKPAKEYIVVFEAWIDGKLARVEVPADIAVLNSREGRKQAQTTADLSFRQLSPNYKPGRLKAVDIVEVTPEGH